MNLKYEGNTTLISLEEIEKALLEHYGEDELTDSGCGYNGRWLSLLDVMEAIKERA